MACSSVSLTGPAAAWPKAVSTNATQQNTIPAAKNALFRSSKTPPLVLKRRLQFRELISVARDPNIQRGQQNNAQQKRGDQAANYHDREWPLRVRSRSEEHTSELQSLRHLVCRLLLE